MESVVGPRLGEGGGGAAGGAQPVVLLPAKAVAGVTTRADVMAVAWMTAVTVTAMGRMEDRSLGGL